MKLVRDAMGNYTYQYVADQDAISNAEAEFEEAKNKLYNLDKDQVKSSIDEWYSTVSSAVSEINELVAAGRLEEARQLQEYYFGENGLLKQMQADVGALSDAFGGEEWFKNFEKYMGNIGSLNFSDLNQTINSFLGSEEGTLIYTLNELGDIFEDDSVFVTAVHSLAESLNSEKLNTQAEALLNASSALLDPENGLPNLISKVGELSQSLSEQATQYQTWLESQVNNGDLRDNTTALRNLTAAMTMLYDATDNNTIDNSYTSSPYWNNDAGWWDISRN
jgi:hypothetical protein